MSFRNRDEDLFEDSRMSFGAHLEELRWVLLKSLIALAIGCCIGFFFAEEVVKQLNVPLKKAINGYHLVDAKEKMIEDKGYIAPDLLPWMDDSYVPQKGKADPVEILKLLQQLSPSIGEDAELNPFKFSAVDFDREKISTVAARLVSFKTDEHSNEAQLKAVWNRTPKSLQIKIEAIAKKSEVSDADVQTIVDAFNEVSGTDLNSDDAFAELLAEPSSSYLSKVFSKEEEKPLAKMKSWIRENPNDATTANRQLNRALVHGLLQNDMPPLRRSMGEFTVWVPLDFQPQSLATTDGFLIWLKAGLITGLLIALPAILWFLWTFVAAGLYPHEQKYVYIFLPISLLLFFSGVLLAFFFVFAPVLDFLFSFNKAMGIAPEMRINDWLSFGLFLPLGFGIAFQLPLVMLFANRIGLVTVEAYIDKWRIAVMAISVISMLLTPADPISMILMAAPLTVLYFLGIGMCKWMPSPARDNPFAESTT